MFISAAAGLVQKMKLKFESVVDCKLHQSIKIYCIVFPIRIIKVFMEFKLKFTKSTFSHTMYLYHLYSVSSSRQEFQCSGFKSAYYALRKTARTHRYSASHRLVPLSLEKVHYFWKNSFYSNWMTAFIIISGRWNSFRHKHRTVHCNEWHISRGSNNVSNKLIWRHMEFRKERFSDCWKYTSRCNRGQEEWNKFRDERWTGNNTLPH